MTDGHLINLSAAWVPPDAADGRGAWLRRFGRPTGLAAGDRVWLEVESAVGCRLLLDGDPLPAVAAGGTLRHEITDRLRPRHELLLEPAVTGSLPAAGPRGPLPPGLGRVRLTIVPAAPPPPAPADPA